MKPRRADRVAEVMKQELALMLMREVKDPGVQGVVVTTVRMSDDLSVARVLYVLEDPSRDRREAAKGLERVKGFLRAQIRRRLTMRVTPELHFTYDEGLQHSRRVEELLGEIKRKDG